MKLTLKDWILATRPWSFPASAMPVIVTLAWLYANGIEVNWWLGAAALVNIILVHAAGNVWSDYFDYKRGVDREDTFGVKILTSGKFTTKQVLRLSITLQVLAIVMGLFMVYATGLLLLWIGIAGIALSLLYPPLKYHALGDLVILLCYSVLPMLGTSFIACGAVHYPVLWLAVPVGLITVAILHANNTRDIETDQRAQISNFPMFAGRKVSSWIYVFEVLFPYLWMIGLVVAQVISWPALFTLLSLPLAWKNVRMMMNYREGGIASFATLDEKTAQLQLAFSTLLVIGLVVMHII